MAVAFDYKTCIFVDIQDTDVLKKLYLSLKARNPDNITVRLDADADPELQFNGDGELILGGADFVAMATTAMAEGKCLLVNGENPDIDVPPDVNVRTTILPAPDASAGLQTISVMAKAVRDPGTGQPNLICPCTGG